jgi:hypothetical protein
MNDEEKASTILLPTTESLQTNGIQNSIHPYHLSAIIFYIASRISLQNSRIIYEWCKDFLQSDYSEDIEFLDQISMNELRTWMYHLEWMLRDEIIKPKTSDEAVVRFQYKKDNLNEIILQELQKIYEFFINIQYVLYRSKCTSKYISKKKGKLQPIKILYSTKDNVTFTFKEFGVSVLDIWQSIRILCIRFGFKEEQFKLDIDKKTVMVSKQIKRIIEYSTIPYLCSLHYFVSRTKQPCLVYPFHQNSFYHGEEEPKEMTFEKKHRMLYSLKSLVKMFDQSRSITAWPDPENVEDSIFFEHYKTLPKILELFDDKEELLTTMKQPFNDSGSLWVAGSFQKRRTSLRKYKNTKMVGFYNDIPTIYSALKGFCYAKCLHGISRESIRWLVFYLAGLRGELSTKHRLVNNLALYLFKTASEENKTHIGIPMDFFDEDEDQEDEDYYCISPAHMVFYQFIQCPEVPNHIAVDVFLNLHVMNPQLQPINFSSHHPHLEFIKSDQLKNLLETNTFKRKRIEEENEETLKKRRLDPIHIKPDNRMIDCLFRFMEEMFYHPSRMDPIEACEDGSEYRGNYSIKNYGDYKGFEWEDSNIPIQWDNKTKTFLFAKDLFPIWTSELKLEEYSKVPVDEMTRQGRKRYLEKVQIIEKEVGPFIGSEKIFLESIVLSPCKVIDFT